MYEEFNGTGRSLKGLQNEGSYYTTWSSVIKGLSQNTWYHHHPVTSGISHFWQNFPFSSKSTPYPPHTHTSVFLKKKKLNKCGQNPAWIQISEKKTSLKQLSHSVSSQHKWDIHELCISENFTETSSYFVSIFSWNMSLHSSKRLLGHKSKFSFSFLPFLPFCLSFLLCLYLSSLLNSCPSLFFFLPSPFY